MIAETTVLLCVYRGTNPSHFKECLISIKHQNVRSFSVLVVLDGMVEPELFTILSEFETVFDLKILQLDENQGLAIALNHGIQEVTTKYVTRIDCDDVMQPDRLLVQLQYLEAHPEVSVVGSNVNIINSKSGVIERKRIVPDKPERSLSAKFITPMNHPSVTFRVADVISVGGYPIFRKAQDRALWCTLMKNGYILRNQSEYLTNMRNSGKKSRAWSYLKYELQVARYLYSIKFLTLFQLFLNVLLLSCHRTYNEFIIRMKK